MIHLAGGEGAISLRVRQPGAGSAAAGAEGRSLGERIDAAKCWRLYNCARVPVTRGSASRLLCEARQV